MQTEEKRIWGIHTQDDNLFLQDNIIAIGWAEMGNLSAIDATRDAFKEKYTQTYPGAKKGSIPTVVGMLYRFCHEAQLGDYIVFPSKSNHAVNIGNGAGSPRRDSHRVRGGFVLGLSLVCQESSRRVEVDDENPVRRQG